MPRWAGIKQVLKHWSCTSNQVQMIMTTKIQKMTKIRAWNMVCFCTIRYLFLWSGFLHREIASNIQVVFLQKGPKMFVKIIKNIFPFSCIIGIFWVAPSWGLSWTPVGSPVLHRHAATTAGHPMSTAAGRGHAGHLVSHGTAEPVPWVRWFVKRGSTRWAPAYQFFQMDLSSWWFQPIWKILVKMGIFPK